MTYQLRHAVVMYSFQCLHHQIEKQLFYLLEDLNLLGLFDRTVGLTTKLAMVNVSENVEEDEPLSQTRINVINTKSKPRVECVKKTAKG